MHSLFANYRATDPFLWGGRNDSKNSRYFQNVSCLSLETDRLPETPATLLLGFASDCGVQRNQGRTGAKLGPDHIRRQLAKLAFQNSPKIIDIGNIVCESDDLEASQQELATLVDECHRLGHRTILLGGGHEIAWPHYRGLNNHYKKLSIINFDAHFDLRALPENGLGNSGTPFRQIAGLCQQQNKPFEYCCLGIQEQTNTRELFDFAKENGVTYLLAEAIHDNSFAWHSAFLDEFLFKADKIYLSLCLDVFAECFAPGVSAPQPMGLTPWQTLALLKYIMQTGKVVSFDIAELSPPHDENEKTARLAALIIAKLLEH